MHENIRHCSASKAPEIELVTHARTITISAMQVLIYQTSKVWSLEEIQQLYFLRVLSNIQHIYGEWYGDEGCGGDGGMAGYCRLNPLPNPLSSYNARVHIASIDFQCTPVDAGNIMLVSILPASMPDSTGVHWKTRAEAAVQDLLKSCLAHLALEMNAATPSNSSCLAATEMHSNFDTSIVLFMIHESRYCRAGIVRLRLRIEI